MGWLNINGNWIGRHSGKSWSSYWTPSSVVVENASPTDVVLTYAKAVNPADAIAGNFTIAGKTISGAVLDGTGKILTLTVTVAFVYGDSITVVANSTNIAVTNNISAEAELVTYITGLATPLSLVIRRKINELIKYFKTGWSVATLSVVDDCEYILAGETAESSLKNLVKNAHHAVAVNSPVFTAFEGFTGDGISSYLDTNYNPNTEGFKLTLNDASIAIYSRTELDISSYSLGCGKSGGGSHTIGLVVKYNNQMQTRINEGTTGAVANTTSLGMAVGVRLDNATNKSYMNKNHLGDLTKASIAIPNNNAFICCYNVDGSATSFNNRQVSFVRFGMGFDATKVNVLTDGFEAYMDSNGKGVIA